MDWVALPIDALLATLGGQTALSLLRSAIEGAHPDPGVAAILARHALHEVLTAHLAPDVLPGTVLHQSDHDARVRVLDGVAHVTYAPYPNGDNVL